MKTSGRRRGLRDKKSIRLRRDGCPRKETRRPRIKNKLTSVHGKKTQYLRMKKNKVACVLGKKTRRLRVKKKYRRVSKEGAKVSMDEKNSDECSRKESGCLQVKN